MPSGALSSVHYGYEKYFNSDAGTGVDWDGAYKTAESSMIYTFGHGVKISNLERNNNVENIWGLGSRSPTVNLPKQFSGSFSVDFVLSNPDIFTHIMGSGLLVGSIGGASTTLSSDVRASNYDIVVSSAASIEVGDVLKLTNSATNTEYIQVGAVSGTTVTSLSALVFDYSSGDDVDEYTDSTSGVYTHVYKEMNNVPSIQILNSLNLSTDQQFLLKGCINNNATISAAINEPATVKLDYTYMNEVRSATGFTAQTVESYDVFAFSHGSVSMPNSTTLANIQNIEIGITQNNDVIYGLGNRTGTSAVGKNREYSLSASMYFLDPEDLLDYLYNGTDSGTTPACSIADTTIKLVFDNCQTGNDNKTIQFDFGNVMIDTETLNQAVDAAIVEDVTFKTLSGQISAKTSESTIPFIWI